MVYNNDDMRRHDRAMPRARAEELLAGGEYGVLSMASSGGAYGVPMNYVWDGDGRIYFHCAMEGRKLRLLEADGRVSFCVVGYTRLLPERLTTERESVLLEGVARVVLSDVERRRAVELLLEKYAPESRERNKGYVAKSFPRTNILCLDIARCSGKGMTTGPIIRLGHVGVWLKDIEAARDFFVKYFGAVPNSIYNNVKTGFSSYFLTFGNGTRLELMSRPEVSAGAAGMSRGYAHVSFSVGGAAAVDSLTSRLSADGFRVADGPRRTGDGCYESCVEGPEGILVEIAE